MLKNIFFITGIGTGIGKTLISAILTQALDAGYWKPVQAGYENSTDSERIRSIVSNPQCIVHPETYKFKLAASPHIAAREEGIEISLDTIKEHYYTFSDNNSTLIIEGAGGLLVPLNQNEFVIDLIKKLQARVILISRNYLGSINHSLLTAGICRQHNLDITGWIFNDQYLNYENEIVNWTGYPKIASIKKIPSVSKDIIASEAFKLKHIFFEILQHA